MQYDVAISNPPFNIKWEPPELAEMMPEYIYGVPPKANANTAFILKGLLKINNRALFILPNGVLSASTKEENKILRNLIEQNILEAVISLPSKMFTNTDIPTCILIFNKNKKTALIEMVDLTEKATNETREQNGQFGGTSHTGRIYKKDFNILSNQVINDVVSAISDKKDVKSFCKSISKQDLEKTAYSLQPRQYIETEHKEPETRNYKDIATDLNMVIEERNSLKLTINDTLSKRLGIYEVAIRAKESQNLNSEINKSLSLVGEKLAVENYISLSKNKLELKFENHSKDGVSSILMMILQMWKQHVFYLNQQENKYLAELRDKLLPDLMSGKISVESEENNEV